jgi:hypothetical protein
MHAICAQYYYLTSNLVVSVVYYRFCQLNRIKRPDNHDIFDKHRELQHALQRLFVSAIGLKLVNEDWKYSQHQT